MWVLPFIAALFGFEALVKHRARLTLTAWAQREGYRLDASRYRNFWEKGYRWQRGDTVFDIRVRDGEGRTKTGDAVVGTPWAWAAARSVWSGADRGP